ncbi:FAD/NAD(P)-binding protein [Pseudoroseicyclus tamaricis]|uniref:FAD-dependent urate hydroxylase HpyO/Asp monooxygenase CreE-like FAD/NAD(P)-binding domain-containing protein n=1 Tax=Pseudoroseicyclus tamaricis TaxID=2705421 RepID=A0A6B2JYA6_9RHOB|nr:FAD/NAD(P)-binding protein [Pseudoroseicyclus tamaricis]NDV01589.1 hypothetical protein [Pseudoroseicyclus tamaricis]
MNHVDTLFATITGAAESSGLADDGPAPVRIGIVGGGPTSVYTLLHLIRSQVPLQITIYEREGSAGPGMPYREGTNDAIMLSNIDSREVPPVTRTLVGFLRSLDSEQLRAYEVTRSEIDESTFYPRLVLGAFYTAELAEVVARGRSSGHSIEIATRHHVADIAPGPDGTIVTARTTEGLEHRLHDHVVIATGHDWPDQVMSNGVALRSPWPAHSLRPLARQRVAILGSSLSAIDVVVTLATAAGAFVEEGEGLVWEPEGDAQEMDVTLLSRKGLLPEADWYYPLPLPELEHMTPEAVAKEAKAGQSGLLTRIFALLAAEMKAADPAYAARVSLAEVEGFAERHFAERLASDPWDWARANLAEAAANRRSETIVQWRRVLVTAHEVLEEVTPRLSDADLERFHKHLKPVFTDGYASVPHRSIKRLLALHDAGRLHLERVGSETLPEADGHAVRFDLESGPLIVDAVVDARGQRATTLEQLGFRSLTRATQSDAFPPSEGYNVPLAAEQPGSVQCLALPVLLRSRPFVQGLVNAADMGEHAAAEILSHLPAAAESPARQTA